MHFLYAAKKNIPRRLIVAFSSEPQPIYQAYPHYDATKALSLN